MISHFLQTNRKKQLQIIKELLRNGPTGYISLSKTIQISEPLLKRYVQAINSDINISKSEIVVEKNTEGLLEINTEFQKNNKDFYTNIQIFYLRDSLTFQLCKLICTYSQVTVNTVGDKLMISRAHAYRIIKELNSILAIFDISIESNSNSILTLSGKGLAIRTFLYDFVIQCIPHDEWIFTTTSKLEIQANIIKIIPTSTTDYSQHQIFIFFAILQNRIKTNNYLPVITNQNLENYLEIFECFPKLDVFDFFISKNLSNPKIIHTEYLYLSFFSCIFLKDFLTDNNINSIENILLKLNDPIHLMLGQLVNQWEKEFAITLSTEQKKKFIFSCSTVYTLTVTMKLKLFKIWDFENPINPQSSFIDANLLQKLLNFLTAFREATNFKKIFKSDISNLFFILFYLQTIKYQHHSLSIFLYFSKNINAKEFIYNFLNQTYNPNSIRFVKKEQDADIVITDCFDLPPNKNQEIIFVTDFFSKFELNSLLKKINQYFVP